MDCKKIIKPCKGARRSGPTPASASVHACRTCTREPGPFQHIPWLPTAVAYPPVRASRPYHTIPRRLAATPFHQAPSNPRMI
ncbi:MAG: hypothetical protein WEB89_04305, partial [Balneolales bacterium]